MNCIFIHTVLRKLGRTESRVDFETLFFAGERFEFGRSLVKRVARAKTAHRQVTAWFH